MIWNAFSGAGVGDLERFFWYGVWVIWNGFSLRRVHCREILIYVFPEKELRGLSPFHINASMSVLYITTFGPPIFLQQNRQTDQGNLYIAHGNMNVGIGTAAAQVPFLEIFVSNFWYGVFAVWVISNGYSVRSMGWMIFWNS